MTILDASAYAEALTSAAPLGEASRERITTTRHWHAPAVFPAEVLAAVRGLLLGGQLTRPRAEMTRRRLSRTRVVLHPFAPFEERVWELRDNLTVYDAWYAALAERLGAALVTTDARLAQAAGPHCEVELITDRPPPAA